MTDDRDKTDCFILCAWARVKMHKFLRLHHLLMSFIFPLWVEQHHLTLLHAFIAGPTVLTITLSPLTSPRCTYSHTQPTCPMYPLFAPQLKHGLHTQVKHMDTPTSLFFFQASITLSRKKVVCVDMLKLKS